MKILVAGMKRFDGVFEGREYHQTKLHCIEKDVKMEGLVGDRVTIVTVKDEINPPPISVGKEYLVYFDQTGKHCDYIRPCEK